MNNHQEIVKKLLQTKAVDFKAIGNLLGELGPSIAMRDEPWENFCLTMRGFIHVYRHFPRPWEVEDLSQLGEAAGELRRKTAK